MNKIDFIKAVAERKGISTRRASRDVNDVMDTLRVVLSKGESVQLGGLGTFEVLTDLCGDHIPVFKGSKVLKKAINIQSEQWEDI